MGVSKFNSAGYIDLTAYEALMAIEREAKQTSFKPLVFICSPFAGDVDRNIENARRYCKYAVAQDKIPLAPHLLFPQFMNDGNAKERRLAIFMGLVLLSKCVELWCFGEIISEGMKVEMTKAKKRDMPIRHFSDACLEVETD
ncbi:MAG: hypothetical protein DDT33_00599 [Firmicutes bacterium]|nr:hypothetical protein [Bacillota bacterium]